MYYGYYGLDGTYILVLIGMIITLAASFHVNSTFKKYSSRYSSTGMTGAEVAREILRQHGIYDVRVERIAGSLTDNYNPQTKTLNLSETVYGSSSVAAIGVAAHECGHAVQDSEDYMPLRLRASIVPLVNIGSSLAWPVILIGLILGAAGLLQLGILMFSLVVLFQLVTLPVEFDASGRAVACLEGPMGLPEAETRCIRKVLGAAAMTYVAAAASSMLQLLRLIILFSGNGRRRR